MLKKIFKAAKKAAPIIGGTIGFALGGPMGASIGSGLGSLAGGRSPEDALKAAAIAGAMGFGAKNFLGMPGGKGLGSLKAFGSNFAPNLGGGAAMVTQPGASITQAKTAGSLAKPNLLQKGLGFIKENPIKSALGAALGVGALGGFGEEEEKITFEDVYGTQNPLRDLGQADIAPNKIIPFSQYASGFNQGGLASFRNGGFNYINGDVESLTASDNIDDRIMQNLEFERMAPGMMGYADGGDFPRKNGKIAGPGTETSDDIPAMLSDGEFVINSKTVRGLGAAMGGKGKQDTRDRGSKFLYSLQDKYGGKR
jgi:hypothetical protein